MKRMIQIGVFLAALIQLFARRCPASCSDSTHCFTFGQFAPTAGGWNPGGGLWHWWAKCCFPCCGAPDDYCRKPLPCVCWPDYSAYYKWGPPEICHGQCGCGAAGGKGFLASLINAAKR
jgi:hypothetical protein